MTRGKRSEAQAILRHWRLAVPDDRLAHLIRDAGRALARALSIRLADHNVSFGHWSFLRILWEEDGLTQRELSEQAGVMEPTTFSALKSMERLGLVTRRQLGSDRKKVHVFLTSKGRLLKRRLVPIAEEVNAIAIKDVPAAHIEVMRAALLAIIENTARDELMRDKRMPSTRAMARLLRETAQQSAGKARKRA
jgi:MarR family transcriptional regulator, organic hydroperoxide resistance regulator